MPVTVEHLADGLIIVRITGMTRLGQLSLENRHGQPDIALTMNPPMLVADGQRIIIRTNDRGAYAVTESILAPPNTPLERMLNLLLRRARRLWRRPTKVGT